MSDDRTDLRTLGAAFAELERRADAAAAATTFAVPARRHHARIPLVAAASVGVLAVATGATLLAEHAGSGARHVAAGGASSPAALTTAAAPGTVSSPGITVPATPEELEQRFRDVLAGSATFTVTDSAGSTVGGPEPTSSGSRVPGHSHPSAPATLSAGSSNGAAIVGTLTAGGVTGGFDLQILQDGPGGHGAWCDRPRHCTIKQRADGSSLAVGREGLEGGGVTYQADLVTGDGVEILMHVSNQHDPKGDSRVLAAHPPLTEQQLAAIVTSDRW
jgi:hypothetical protein